jgi:hypothetical protein
VTEYTYTTDGDSPSIPCSTCKGTGEFPLPTTSGKTKMTHCGMCNGTGRQHLGVAAEYKPLKLSHVEPKVPEVKYVNPWYSGDTPAWNEIGTDHPCYNATGTTTESESVVFEALARQFQFEVGTVAPMHLIGWTSLTGYEMKKDQPLLSRRSKDSVWVPVLWHLRTWVDRKQDRDEDSNLVLPCGCDSTGAYLDLFDGVTDFAWPHHDLSIRERHQLDALAHLHHWVVRAAEAHPDGSVQVYWRCVDQCPRCKLFDDMINTKVANSIKVGQTFSTDGIDVTKVGDAVHKFTKAMEPAAAGVKDMRTSIEKLLDALNGSDVEPDGVPSRDDPTPDASGLLPYRYGNVAFDPKVYKPLISPAGHVEWPAAITAAGTSWHNITPANPSVGDIRMTDVPGKMVPDYDVWDGTKWVRLNIGKVD